MKVIVIFECSDALSGVTITQTDFLGLQAQEMFDIKAVSIDTHKKYNLAEQMKANELMLGDWVFNRNILENMQVYPMMFSQMFRQNPDAMTEDYNILPIPITPGILEKNGWKETYGWWRLSDCPFWLVHYSEKSWAKGKWGVRFNEDSDDDGFLIWGIHELQHALRLCGVAKTIEL